MKNKIYNLFLIGGLLSALMFSCDDNVDDLVETLDFDRLMSVTDVTAEVTNQVSVDVDFTANANADYYTLQFYNDSVEDFNDESLSSSSETFVKEVTVYADSLPYTTTFESEEMYSVRVKAYSDSISESLWSGTTFETKAENIFNTLPDSLIGKKYVTLSWTAGEDVDYFLISPKRTDGTDSIRITTDQVAAGEAYIDGLDYETEYTVKMYRDESEKRRGKITFTTLPQGTTLTDGTDIAAAINGDTEENIFLLEGGTYYASDAIIVDRDIKIQALSSSDTAYVHAQFDFESTDAVTLNLINIVLDGTSTGTLEGEADLDDLFAINSSCTSIGSIVLSGCYIHDYTDDFFYFGKAGFAMDALTVDDCIIDGFGCGHSFIDIRDGLVSNISFTNSTIANCGASSGNYLIRYDGAAKGPNSLDDGTNFPVITFSNCTMYNNMATCSKSLVYARWDEDAGITINVSNTIFAGKADYACKLYDTSVSTPTVSLTNNFYYQASTIMAQDDGGSEVTSIPFSDATNSDFTLTDSNIISAAAGDPRWISE